LRDILYVDGWIILTFVSYKLGAEWTKMVQGSEQRHDLQNKLQQPTESIKAGNFLTNSITLSFSRKTVALWNQKFHNPLNSILNQKHIKPSCRSCFNGFTALYINVEISHVIFTMTKVLYQIFISTICGTCPTHVTFLI
jgi:hypothetical protein